MKSGNGLRSNLLRPLLRHLNLQRNLQISQSSQWQQLAKIPEPEFERRLAFVVPAAPLHFPYTGLNVAACLRALDG